MLNSAVSAKWCRMTPCVLDKLRDLAKGLPGKFLVVADMTSPKDIARIIDRTIKRYARLDILLATIGARAAGSCEPF